MNRRNFINRSAAILVAGSAIGRNMMAAAATSPSMASTTTSLAASAAAQKRNKGRIGFQLYSIRQTLKDDFVGTLKKLSDIGYSAVETFGLFDDKFFGHTMKELDAIVKDMGMSISGGMYQGWQMIPEDTNTPEWDNWKYCISELKSVGAKWAVQASMPGVELKNMDEVKRIAAHFNRVGELCGKSGLKFAFHTHPQDLKMMGDVQIFEYLLKNTEPKLVSYQMDWGNIVNAGGDCVQYLRDYPGRFPLWHTTDFDVVTRKSAQAGKGSVPYPEMFNLAKSSRLEQLTVELHVDAENLDVIKSTFDYFKQFKWTKV